MKFYGNNDVQSIRIRIASQPISYMGAVIMQAGLVQKDGKMVCYIELENGSQEIADKLILLMEIHHTLPVKIGPNGTLEIDELQL